MTRKKLLKRIIKLKKKAVLIKEYQIAGYLMAVERNIKYMITKKDIEEVNKLLSSGEPPKYIYIDGKMMTLSKYEKLLKKKKK